MISMAILICRHTLGVANHDYMDSHNEVQRWIVGNRFDPNNSVEITNHRSNAKAAFTTLSGALATQMRLRVQQRGFGTFAQQTRLVLPPF